MLPSIILDQKHLEPVRNYIKNNLQQDYFLQESEHTHRKIINLGYDYFKLADGDRTFQAIPPMFYDLLQKALDQLKDIADIEVIGATAYLNCIISDYQPGDNLEPHIDVDITKQRTLGKDVDFFFGDEVIGIVLECDDTGKFFIQESLNGERPLTFEPHGQKVNETDGTTFVLKGTVRRFPYYHGVTPVKNRRLSLTFRTVNFPD